MRALTFMNSNGQTVIRRLSVLAVFLSLTAGILCWAPRLTRGQSERTTENDAVQTC